MDQLLVIKTSLQFLRINRIYAGGLLETHY
jgi:hypothetical protein